MNLLQNPFHILTASPRDNRRRIMELADERSLLLDSSECMEARSKLINPRKRLSSEVAWLPGTGPKRAREILSLIELSPAGLLDVDKLTSIARANLLAAGLARLPDCNSDDIAKWILKIAWAFEGIDPEKLRVIINEERVASGFPEVTDISTVEVEIQERRRYYRKVIKSALGNLAFKEHVEAVTIAVTSATDDGEKQGPTLISDLVDSYEVDVQEFLEKEEGNIKALVEQLRASVDTKRPDSTLAPLVNRLIQVVKNWDTVAQPIQVSTKSQGRDHGPSHRVAVLVRDLAIYMFNKHGKLDFSKQLTNMLQEVFAEVGKVAERTAEDAGALDEITEQYKVFLDKMRRQRRGGKLVGKWKGIIGIVFVIFVLFGIYEEQSSKPQYEKPPVGNNDVFSVPEIRWCFRERIRIKAMEDAIGAYNTNTKRIVDDYISRCTSSQPQDQDSLSRAQRDVRADYSQIYREAIHEARQLAR